MAEKKPLCNYNGDIKELQSGDTLPGGSGDIDDGTTERQMTFWDDSNSKWTYTDRLWYDNTNHRLQVAGTSYAGFPYALTIRGGTVFGIQPQSSNFSASDYTTYLLDAGSNSITITLPIPGVTSTYGAVYVFHVLNIDNPIKIAASNGIDETDFHFTNVGETLIIQSVVNESSTHVWKIIGSYKEGSTNKRNYFINGNLEIWQRGTSFAAFGGGNYCADRIRSSGTGSYAITASQSTDVPSNSLYNFLNYSLKIDCTTAEAAVAASEYAMIDHRIEGINVANLKNRPCILSFWVKSTKTGTMGVSIYNTPTWGYLTTITINQASTWERKIVKFYIDTSSGTWNFDNSVAIDLRFCLMCGSNFQSSSTEQWNAGNYLSNASQTNFLDSTANDIYFAGFQLIEGGHDLVCKPLSMEAQVEQCQRYYEKSYNLTTDPGTVTNVGSMQTRTAAATRHLSSLQRVFMTRKRDTPTVDWYSPDSGTVSRIYDASGASDYTLSSDARAGEASTGYPNVTVAIPDGSLIMGHWTANAEL
jgi:hypothetical protein